jgi:copper(I)-binding protein
MGSTGGGADAHAQCYSVVNMVAWLDIPQVTSWNRLCAAAVCNVLVARRCALRGSVFRLCSALLLGLATALPVSAANAMFIVNQPWVRPAQVAQSTEAYMDLTSTEGATLVGVATDAAKATTIRAPGKAAVTARKVTLPPQALVALAPGRYRIALIYLLRTLKLGDRVPMTLTIELADGSRQDIPIDAEVRLRSPLEDERRAHSHSQPH